MCIVCFSAETNGQSQTTFNDEIPGILQAEAKSN